LRELLALYCEETAALGRGVRALGPLASLREGVAGRLFGVMSEVAAQLAHDMTQRVYRAPPRGR
jgi:hypothetical protein